MAAAYCALPLTSPGLVAALGMHAAPSVELALATLRQWSDAAATAATAAAAAAAPTGVDGAAAAADAAAASGGSSSAGGGGGNPARATAVFHELPDLHACARVYAYLARKVAHEVEEEGAGGAEHVHAAHAATDDGATSAVGQLPPVAAALRRAFGCEALLAVPVLLLVGDSGDGNNNGGPASVGVGAAGVTTRTPPRGPACSLRFVLPCDAVWSDASGVVCGSVLPPPLDSVYPPELRPLLVSTLCVRGAPAPASLLDCLVHARGAGDATLAARCLAHLGTLLLAAGAATQQQQQQGVTGGTQLAVGVEAQQQQGQQEQQQRQAGSAHSSSSSAMTLASGVPHGWHDLLTTRDVLPGAAGDWHCAGAGTADVGGRHGWRTSLFAVDASLGLGVERSDTDTVYAAGRGCEDSGGGGGGGGGAPTDAAAAPPYTSAVAAVLQAACAHARITLCIVGVPPTDPGILPRSVGVGSTGSSTAARRPLSASHARGLHHLLVTALRVPLLCDALSTLPAAAGVGYGGGGVGGDVLLVGVQCVRGGVVTPAPKGFCDALRPMVPFIRRYLAAARVGQAERAQGGQQAGQQQQQLQSSQQWERQASQHLRRLGVRAVPGLSRRHQLVMVQGAAGEGGEHERAGAGVGEGAGAARVVMTAPERAWAMLDTRGQGWPLLLLLQQPQPQAAGGRAAAVAHAGLPLEVWRHGLSELTRLFTPDGQPDPQLSRLMQRLHSLTLLGASPAEVEAVASDEYALTPMLSTLTSREGWAPGSEALKCECEVEEEEEEDPDGVQVMYDRFAHEGGAAALGGRGGGGGVGGDGGGGGDCDGGGGGKGSSGPTPSRALPSVASVLGSGTHGAFIGELLPDLPAGSVRELGPLPQPRDDDDDGDTAAAMLAVGRWGEEWVYMCLVQDAVVRSGGGGGVTVVTWLNKDAEQGAPYDILVETRAGGGSGVKSGGGSGSGGVPGTGGVVHTTYVEVKASSLATKAMFEFSHNEWVFSGEMGDAYHIYRVFSAGTHTPTVTRIINPHLQFRQQRLGMCITL
ncbi:hypothetical protein FOA52_012133 [Chlamydomonas sp. UWO 241]|nr:hypothetical protein FOA52_012133 [Chlamydomonas sp. UWO 241]